ncbi:MAG TPA: Hpt domain-containing protein, partial [Allocoleopsis sp.]
MLELFRTETAEQITILNENLLRLKADLNANFNLDQMINAIHIIKGASLLVGINLAVQISAALESCFINAQKSNITFNENQINTIIIAIKLLKHISEQELSDISTFINENEAEINFILTEIEKINLGAEKKSDKIEKITINNDSSLLNLFRIETETQSNILNQGLLSLETHPNATNNFESLMRAAHSLKGAARMIGFEQIVRLAHVMEDCFMAGKNGDKILNSTDIDLLLKAVDVFTNIAQISANQISTWLQDNQEVIEQIISLISQILTQPKSEIVKAISHQISLKNTENTEISAGKTEISQAKSSQRVVRVNGENLSRLMGLAGESLVQSNWLQPFANSLLKLRNKQAELSDLMEKIQESLIKLPKNSLIVENVNNARENINETRQMLNEKLNELENFARINTNLSERIYREVIASNMRPFADGVKGFPRMIRDLARELGKQVKLEIIGESTQVDRDILEKLEAPLTHILRNAIDHGIESPTERLSKGKSVEGLIKLEAIHRGGMLLITISDDGKGINLQELKQKIVSRNLATSDMVQKLTEYELMNFLFLPGFSTTNNVTEISGRGVGLDIAQTMIQEVGGVLRAVSSAGKGMSFYLQLPLTLSVISTLLVEISGEIFAFPLSRIEGVLRLKTDDIFWVENHQYFSFKGKNISLVSVHQVLNLNSSNFNLDVLPVVIISDKFSSYGLVVDQFLGEKKLVVKPLDHRLGKVKNISAAALMEDGKTVLIIDIEDLIFSLDNLLGSGQLNNISNNGAIMPEKIIKRLLVVDDS